MRFALQKRVYGGLDNRSGCFETGVPDFEVVDGSPLAFKLSRLLQKLEHRLTTDVMRRLS
jgi:hypothetical protein